MINPYSNALFIQTMYSSYPLNKISSHFGLIFPLIINSATILVHAHKSHTSILNIEFNWINTFPMSVDSFVLSSPRCKICWIGKFNVYVNHFLLGVMCYVALKSKYHTSSDNWLLVRHNVNNCGFLFTTIFGLLFMTWHNILNPTIWGFIATLFAWALEIPFAQSTMRNQHSFAWWLGFWQ
jgi:hypothetical protein